MNYIIKDNKVYRKGTLAHFLDRRGISIGEPTATDLPETINPFKFVRQNLLKNNCAIIKLKHSEMVYSGDLLGLLNELIPAEQAILIYIDVDDLNTPVVIKGATKVKTYETRTVEQEVGLGITAEVAVTRLEEVCE